MRFWDTSALVPLVVEEAATAAATEWIRDDPHVAAWTLASVEARSAIRRLVSESALGERDAARAESKVDELARRFHLVIDVDGAKRVAARLLRSHPLRAADSLQLAATILWARHHPEGKVLHTLDPRLGEAAAREGFTVVPSSR